MPHRMLDRPLRDMLRALRHLLHGAMRRRRRRRPLRRTGLGLRMALLGFDRRHQFGDRRIDGRLGRRAAYRAQRIGHDRRCAFGDADFARRPAFGRHDIGDHARARIDALADAAAVIAGNDDRIAVRVDAGDHADMTAVLAAGEHRDGADARLGNAVAVIGEGPGGVGIGAGIADFGQHEIHEGRAPQLVRAVGLVPIYLRASRTRIGQPKPAAAAARRPACWRDARCGLRARHAGKRDAWRQSRRRVVRSSVANVANAVPRALRDHLVLVVLGEVLRAMLMRDAARGRSAQR